VPSHDWRRVLSPAVIGSVFHSFLRKIMHVIACHMPCMHHVSASRPPLRPVRPRVCEMLDLNFREFLFYAAR
jgi:hypothetical protein